MTPFKDDSSKHAEVKHIPLVQHIVEMLLSCKVISSFLIFAVLVLWVCCCHD